MEKKSFKRTLRCVLSEKELVEAARSSAELTRSISTLEDDKSRSNKDFAARIASKESDRALLNDQITSGYVLRDVQCEAELSTPTPGMKRIVRLDSHEEIGVEPMTPDELQRELELETGCKFDEDGVCVDPGLITLRLPGGSASLLVSRVPQSAGGGFRSGLRVDGIEGDSDWECELGGVLFADGGEAVVAAVGLLTDWLKAQEKREKALKWFAGRADKISAALPLIGPGKEVIVE